MTRLRLLFGGLVFAVVAALFVWALGPVLRPDRGTVEDRAERYHEAGRLEEAAEIYAGLGILPGWADCRLGIADRLDRDGRSAAADEIRLDVIERLRSALAEKPSGILPSRLRRILDRGLAATEDGGGPEDDATPREWQIRAAEFLLADGGAEPVLRWEEVRPIGVGERTVFRHRDTLHLLEPPRLPSTPQERFGRHAPGRFSPPRRTPHNRHGWREGAPRLHTVTTLPFDLEAGGNGPLLGWGNGSVSSARVLHDLPAYFGVRQKPWKKSGRDFVSRRHVSATWVLDGSLRTVCFVFLATFEPRTDTVEPRGEDWWRGHIGRNLDRFREKHASAPRLEVAWARFELGEIAGREPGPVALLWTDANTEALDRLRACRPLRRVTERQMVLEAYPLLRRLLEDDASVLDVKPSSGTTLGDALGLLAGSGWGASSFWDRVIHSTREPRILSRALRSRTAPGVPRHLETTVLARCRELGVDPPPELLEREADAARLPGIRRNVAILAVLALLAALVALRPSKRQGPRLRSGVILLVLGLALSTIHLEQGETNLHVESVGLAFAALGTWIASRAVAGPTRLVAPFGFLLAVLAGLVVGLTPRFRGWTSDPIESLGRMAMLRDAGLALGFAGLAILAWLLARSRPALAPGAQKSWRRCTVITFCAGLVVCAVPGSFVVLPVLAVALAWNRAVPGESPPRTARRGRSEPMLPASIRYLGSPPGLFILLAALIVTIEAKSDSPWSDGWWGDAPAVWVAMAACVLALVLAAIRGAPRPVADRVPAGEVT